MGHFLDVVTVCDFQCVVCTKLENVTACSFKIQCCCISCVVAWTSLFILWDRQMTMACACSVCGSEWCRHADMRPISSGLYMCATERFCKKHEIVICLSPDFKNMWTLDSRLLISRTNANPKGKFHFSQCRGFTNWSKVRKLIAFVFIYTLDDL
jgi:hypothetical protein